MFWSWYLSSNKDATFGGIFRDDQFHHGKWMPGFSDKLKPTTSLVTKLRSIKQGIKLEKRPGIQRFGSGNKLSTCCQAYFAVKLIDDEHI